MYLIMKREIKFKKKILLTDFFLSKKIKNFSNTKNITFENWLFFWFLIFKNFPVNNILSENFFFQMDLFFLISYRCNYFFEIIFLFQLIKKPLIFDKKRFVESSKMISYFSSKLVLNCSFNFDFFQTLWNVICRKFEKTYKISCFNGTSSINSSLKLFYTHKKNLSLSEIKLFQNQNSSFFLKTNFEMFNKIISPMKELVLNIFLAMAWTNVFFGFGKYILFFVDRIIFLKMKNKKYFSFVKQILKEATGIVSTEQKINSLKRKTKIRLKILWVEKKNSNLETRTLVRKEMN